MMRMLFVTLIAAIAVTTIPVAADPPPQRPRYVVILRNPRVLLAQPNASAAARFTDPDFPALGGSLVEKWGRYRVIDIATEAMAALLRHPSVESIQRVFTGAALPEPVIPAAGALRASSESLHARSDVSWDSGTYAYDGAGNIKTIGSKSYQYDSAGRLVQYAGNGATIETYAYDSFGNLVEKVTAGQTLSIPTDTGSNRLQGVEYDLNGNVKVNGVDRYESDPLNMMQRRNSSSLEQFYFYTADDERIAVYDNEWRFTIRDFAGHPMREWVAGSMTATATWSWVEDHIYRDGQPLAADRDAGQGGTRHFHLDHLGTPRLITTQSGSGSSVFGYKLAQHDYYPFGVEQTSTIQETTNFGYDRSEPQQFTGHERDSGGGGVLAAGNADYLDYMHARYYSPGLGRFLSADTIGGSAKRPQTWNKYAYSLNNPANRVDPDGRCSVPHGLRQGQVGLCIESFIASATIGGIGRGDHRTFAANNPNLTYRIQTQLIVDPQGGRIVAMNPTAGISGVIGKNWGGRGTNESTIANASASSNGLSFTLNASGTNWWHWAPGAPKGSIMWHLNFHVSPAGGVDIAAGSSISAYPSTAIYAYQMNSTGLVIDHLYTHDETTPDALGVTGWSVPETPSALGGYGRNGITDKTDGGTYLYCVDGQCR